MNLQDTFYTFGIVFMSLNILILIGIAVIIFYIKKKITSIHDNVEAKIEDINDYAVKPVKKVFDIAATIMSGRSKSNRKK